MLSYVKNNKKKTALACVLMGGVAAAGSWAYSQWHKLPMRELRVLMDAVQDESALAAKRRLDSGMDLCYDVGRSISAGLVKRLIEHVQSVRGDDLVQRLAQSRGGGGNVTREEKIQAWKELIAQHFASVVYALYLSTFVELYSHCLAFLMQRHVNMQSAGGSLVLVPDIQSAVYSTAQALATFGAGDLLEYVRSAARTVLREVSLDGEVGPPEIVSLIEDIMRECRHNGSNSNVTRMLMESCRLSTFDDDARQGDPVAMAQLAYFGDYVGEVLSSQPFQDAFASCLDHEYSSLINAVLTSQPPPSSKQQSQQQPSSQASTLHHQNGSGMWRLPMARAVGVVGQLSIPVITAACVAEGERAHTDAVSEALYRYLFASPEATPALSRPSQPHTHP